MSKLKIMVVEDEAIAAMDLKKRLEFWGYDVPATASSGKEAIQKAKKFNPDLVLMDIIIKGDLDGIDVAKKLLDELDLPVIYLTAHSEDKTMERAKLTQPYGYLVKPVGDKELKFALEVALYKHQVNKNLKRTSRALRMLSDCNQMVIRTKDKNDLLNQICRIIVEDGGYILAWVGMKQNNGSKNILPVAQYGYENGYLESLDITWADTKHGQSPVGSTIRTGKVNVSRDILQDPKFELWCDLARERGYNSYISLPIIIEEHVLGALNIYSSEIDAFDDEEVELLLELADDVSYALDSIKSREELENTLKALKLSEEKYHSLYSSMNEGVALHELLFNEDNEAIDYRIIDVNPAFESITGFEKEGVIGIKASRIYKTNEPPFLDIYANVAQSGQPMTFETFYEPMGKYFEISTFSPGNNLFATIFEDVTNRKKAENKIKASLKEKDLLLSEIHHRVKNNLQIISSLLSLQERYIADKDARDIFIESKNRVRSMAAIHDSLYASSNFSSIKLEDYVRSLANMLFSTYKKDPNTVRLIIDLEGIDYDINTAVPLGLIINELLTNSIKHAFPGGREGLIEISINKEDGNSHMIIKDNGVGIPEDVDFENTTTLGVMLVKSLVSQLDGELKLYRGEGTKITLDFKDLIYRDRI